MFIISLTILTWSKTKRSLNKSLFGKDEALQSIFHQQNIFAEIKQIVMDFPDTPLLVELNLKTIET